MEESIEQPEYDQYRDIFVPIYLARDARDYGFIEPCLRAWDDKTTDLLTFQLFRSIAYTTGNVSNSELSGGLIAAPTFEQLNIWFRKEHKINISILERDANNKHAYICNGFEKRVNEMYDYNLTYIFALSTAFLKLKMNKFNK